MRVTLRPHRLNHEVADLERLGGMRREEIAGREPRMDANRRRPPDEGIPAQNGKHHPHLHPILPAFVDDDKPMRFVDLDQATDDRRGRDLAFFMHDDGRQLDRSRDC